MIIFICKWKKKRLKLFNILEEDYIFFNIFSVFWVSDKG